MNHLQLKEVVEAYRKSLEDNSGGVLVFSKTGPVNMGVIDAIVAAIEQQERRLAAMEKRLFQ